MNDTRELERAAVSVSTGRLVDLSKIDSAVLERLKSEVREIEARGDVVEITHEIADLDE